MTNTERAQRAEAAIAAYLVAAYPIGDPDDLKATIVDLVTDLMHLAAQNGISPDDVAEASQDHFDIEDVAERGFYLDDEDEKYGRCAVCQVGTAYSGEHNGDYGVWLCRNHGGGL